MQTKAAVFEQTYTSYVDRLNGLNLGRRAGTLGIRVRSGTATVPFFGQPHTVSATGVFDTAGKRPDYGTCVVLLKYLLMCPETLSLRKDWLTYKDFKDAAPLVHSFISNVQRPIAQRFSGRTDALTAAAAASGGQGLRLDIACDLAFRFDPLPRIPLFLLFNDADAEFAASCTVLFEERAGELLDMECLAIVGMLLADRLCRR